MAIEVKVHPDVLAMVDLLSGKNRRKKAGILSDLADLEFDPEPSQDAWRVTSRQVGSLQEKGHDIRRLKLCASLPNHRFFYHHAKQKEIVYIMELVERNENTYEMDQEHMNRVIQKYIDFCRSV